MPNFEFMELAITEMRKTQGFPKIGAVLVKDCNVLSTGYRHEIGRDHAERVAIEKMNGADISGSTLYTTLEPCVELSESQVQSSCSKLLVDNQIAKVSIGTFDPNGKIYANGWKVLRDGGMEVSFFDSNLQTIVQQETFKYDDFNAGYGSGSRRVRVGRSQKPFEVFFSENDSRSIKFRWSRLNQPKDRFDLVSTNESIRLAVNATTFSEVTDPLAYHDPSHFARLAEDEIAVVWPKGTNMVLLVQISRISETDLEFKWQVRNK